MTDKLLTRKLTEAYQAQEHTTKYFAGLTALAGPALVQEWLTIRFDGAAPTPKTFWEKEATWAESPFLVNRDKREYCVVDGECIQLTICSPFRYTSLRGSRRRCADRIHQAWRPHT